MILLLVNTVVPVLLTEITTLVIALTLGITDIIALTEHVILHLVNMEVLAFMEAPPPPTRVLALHYSREPIVKQLMLVDQARVRMGELVVIF